MDDFLTKSFGPAEKPMRHFFQQIYLFDEDQRRPGVRSNMLGHLYRDLEKARGLVGDDAKINARLDHLLLLTRYEELPLTGYRSPWQPNAA